ncbi:hypothetical protein CCR75_008965 [Bremia lactucae]|uniref:Protein kinase domain-containing protein n=1 Tax=Bremia lactucae TaxID=4779 RepID=A0A976FK63_BRELC|nr:hypothetical protein CCR75_008965 [Bremia lactucae]
MKVPLEWLAAWQVIHWTSLGAGATAALLLLLHSATFRCKRRMTDLLLGGIALADLCFVTLEALKQALHTSYFARYRRKDEGLEEFHYTTGDFILTLMSRFSFFKSLCWIANLSLLMRLGALKALQVKKNLLISSLVSFGYGCMHATLPMLKRQGLATSDIAYTITAVVICIMQSTPLLLIIINLRAVRQSRLYSSTHGRNVIRRLSGYYVCATIFTLPYAMILILSQSYVGVGVIAETLNYFVPVANAILFGSSLRCCCCWATATATATKTMELFKSRLRASLTSSLEISADTFTDKIGSLSPTGYVNLATGGGLGKRDGVLAGIPSIIAEMVTDAAAVKIGEGSSAEVYKAQWLGITIALKCLRIRATDSSDAALYMTHLAELRTEFLDEAVLAARLRHPNITLFMRIGTFKESLCLVTEYCARGSLRDVLRGDPLLEWNTKARLAFEAAKGLAFMHNREPIYLHRDLKASNILVTADWTAKIADFGIARIATNYSVNKQQKSMQSLHESVNIGNGAASELMTTFAGTWRWNAPEIMKDPNECRFNREADVYSFGVSLWEILTNGAIPFGNVDFDHQVRLLVAAGERPLLPSAYLRHAPPEFIEVMCACWHQQPEKRPSAQDVMVRLGSLTNFLSNGSKISTFSQNTSNFDFSDSYCKVLDSHKSCPALW